jgi:hypothetical protein
MPKSRRSARVAASIIHYAQRSAGENFSGSSEMDRFGELFVDALRARRGPGIWADRSDRYGANRSRRKQRDGEITPTAV